MTISITELSTYLGVAPATIERWVKQGKLMAYNKGDDRLRFKTREVKKWAKKQNIRLTPLDDASKLKDAETMVSLPQAIMNGGVFSGITGEDKETILKNCLERAETIHEDFRQDLADRLLEREKALSTGIGNGIAIPHPRDPLGYLPHPMVLVCFLDRPVDYEALDNQQVSLLFILLSNTLKNHLPLLSSLSMCLKNASFSEFLASKPDQAALAEKIDAILSP